VAVVVAVAVVVNTVVVPVRIQVVIVPASRRGVGTTSSTGHGVLGVIHIVMVVIRPPHAWTHVQQHAELALKLFLQHIQCEYGYSMKRTIWEDIEIPQNICNTEKSFGECHIKAYLI
jgi:hypothetical protein